MLNWGSTDFWNRHHAVNYLLTLLEPLSFLECIDTQSAATIDSMHTYIDADACTEGVSSQLSQRQCIQVVTKNTAHQKISALSRKTLWVVPWSAVVSQRPRGPDSPSMKTCLSDTVVVCGLKSNSFLKVWSSCNRPFYIQLLILESTFISLILNILLLHSFSPHNFHHGGT